MDIKLDFKYLGVLGHLVQQKNLTEIWKKMNN